MLNEAATTLDSESKKPVQQNTFVSKIHLKFDLIAIFDSWSVALKIDSVFAPSIIAQRINTVDSALYACN